MTNPLFKKNEDDDWVWKLSGEPVMPSDRRYFGLEDDPAQTRADQPKERSRAIILGPEGSLPRQPSFPC